MTTKTFTNLRAAGRAIQRDAKARERRVRGAVRKTARQVADFVRRQSVPIAFRELERSVHVALGAPGFAEVTADAPHAEAVEVGSRPHTPPLDALIRWVALRGMQGLTAGGRVKKLYGTSRKPMTQRRIDQVWRKRAAATIAHTLRQRLGKSGAAAWRANASAVAAGKATYIKAGDPDTIAIARAIQMSIRKRGTRPHRFMAAAIPQAEDYLHRNVTAALPDGGGNEAGGGDGGDGDGSGNG